MPLPPTLLDFPDDQIALLGDQGLVDVMHLLVHHEVRTNALPLPRWSVPREIKAGDGGIDGHVQWEGGPEKTQFLPGRHVGFQIKAEMMSPAKCKAELLGKEGKLPPEVQELLEAGGTYVMVIPDRLTAPKRKRRIEAMRQAIEEAKDCDLDRDEAHLDAYGAEKVVQWMREHPAVILTARERIGLATHPAARSWAWWNRHLHDAPPLAVPDDYGAQLDALRATLSEEKSIVRLIGQAGLGKTRMGLEATRSQSEDEPGLSGSVLYVENGEQSWTETIEIARALGDAGADTLLVIDDCPAALHDAVGKVWAAPGSRFRVLTMDYDLGPIATRATVPIELTPEEQEPVVRAMIEHGRETSRIAERDVDEAVRFAQGYPEIARLVLDAWEQDGTVGTTLVGHKDLVERILFGRQGVDPEGQRMLEAMAVFKYFGYRSSGERMRRRDAVDTGDQYAFVAREMCNGATRDELYAATKVFMRRGVLERGGEFMRVRPRPLALYLAARWWEGKHPDAVPPFLEAVEAVGLTEPLCQQMELLGEVEHAREIAERLCGASGPFGQAETLSTATGARVLRALAVVYPSAALGALDRAFGSMTTAELRGVEEGRRDLVNALETLAWDRETFAGAARLLLRFAAAENETWSNNATGQHRQLYRLSLSGTEAPAAERLPVLEEALLSADVERRVVAVQGLGSALNTGYVSRSVGSERAGGRIPRVEWQPSTYAEVTDHLTEALRLLTSVAVEGGVAGDAAREELRPRLMRLWNIPAMVVPLADAVREIVAAQPPFGEVALRELSQVLERSEEAPPLKGRDQLVALRDELRPSDTVGRVRLTVMEPVLDMRKKTGDGAREDVGLPKAQALADELIQGNTDWGPLLDVLNGTFGMYARAFGARVGEQCDSAFVERVLDHMETLTEQSWSFAGGVLSSRPEAEQEAARDRVASSESLRVGYAALASVIGIGDETVLLRLFQDRVLGWQALETVRHALQDLPDERLDTFLRGVADAQPGLRGAVFGVAALWERPKGLIRDLLVHDDTLEQILSSSRSYLWDRAAIDALNRGDDELAESLAKRIVEISVGSRPVMDKAIEDVATALLTDYRDVAWPVFRKALEDPARVYALMTVLGASYWGGAPLFEASPVDDLIAWARSVEHAPSALARSTPVFAPEPPSRDDPMGRMGPPRSPAWHPATRALIKAFGGDEAFLSSLGANLFSFGSSGSRIPYYEARQTLLRELLGSSHAAVREWARQQLAYYDTYIADEIAEHEEERLRYG